MKKNHRVFYEVIIKAVPQFKHIARCSSTEKAKSQARRAWKRHYAIKEAILFESIEITEAVEEKK